MFITCKCWTRVAERISSAVKLFIITGQFGCYEASVVISEKLYTSRSGHQGERSCTHAAPPFYSVSAAFFPPSEQLHPIWPVVIKKRVISRFVWRSTSYFGGGFESLTFVPDWPKGISAKFAAGESKESPGWKIPRPASNWNRFILLSQTVPFKSCMRKFPTVLKHICAIFYLYLRP